MAHTPANHTMQSLVDEITQLTLPEITAQIRMMPLDTLLQDPVYAAIFQLGRDDYAQMVHRYLDHAVAQTTEATQRLHPAARGPVGWPTTQTAPHQALPMSPVATNRPITPREPTEAPESSGATRPRGGKQMSDSKKRKYVQYKKKLKARKKLIRRQNRLAEHPEPHSGAAPLAPVPCPRLIAMEVEPIVTKDQESSADPAQNGQDLSDDTSLSIINQLLLDLGK